MKSNLILLKLAAFAVCALLATKSLGGPIYEYDWIGGQSGFHGQIFLDAPTSATAPHGGTFADVLGGSLTTPLGTFPIYNPTLSSSFFVPVAWDQTRISLMDLFFEPTSPILNPVYGLPAVGQAQVNFQGVQNGLETSVLPLNGGVATAFVYDDFSGQWLAVPEPSALTLGIFGLAGLLLCRRGLRATQNYGKRQTPRPTYKSNPVSRKTWSCWRILSRTWRLSGWSFSSSRVKA
jgi:hypothetical protein